MVREERQGESSSPPPLSIFPTPPFPKERTGKRGLRISGNTIDGRPDAKQDQTELGIGHGIYEYSDIWLAGVVRVVATVVASLLPTCSVVLQYFIRDDLIKLYLIVLASAVFALALAVMTNARMVEVFAATSAYVSFLNLWSHLSHCCTVLSRSIVICDVRSMG